MSKANTNSLPEVLKNKGVSEETVEALSSLQNEPGWLTEKRLHAWQTFQQLPMPTMRDEAWRYTDISDVNVEDFAAYTPSPDVESESELPDAVQQLIREGEENSALIVQHNSETTYTRIDEELKSKGVVLTDLHAALEEHEEIVKEHLFGLVPEDYDKFAALSAAVFSGGSFLYVPRGVDVEVPIQSYRWLDGTGSITPRTLVVVEEGASVTYIDEYASATGEEPALSNGAVELFVGQGANLRYVSLQNWERNVLHFNTIRSSAGKDSTINSLVVALGSELSRTNVEAGLTEDGSDSEMLGLYFADEEQVLDHHTLQDHLAPNAHSDLLVQGRAARRVARGILRSHPGRARGAEDRRLPDKPEPDPGHRRRDGRQPAAPGDSGRRREVLPRLDHRAGGRSGALLPDEPGHPAPRGREARRLRFLRRGNEPHPAQGAQGEARPGDRRQDRARLRGACSLAAWPSSTK